MPHCRDGCGHRPWVGTYGGDNMKRTARVALAQRFLRAVLAFAFASSITLGNVSLARAGTLPPSAPTNGALSDSGNSRDASPTVVREIEASRTADSSTFAMSDGSFESKLFTDAVHYQDETGAWKDIDVSLVPTVVPGVAHTAASAYDETFASEEDAKAWWILKLPHAQRLPQPRSR